MKTERRWLVSVMMTFVMTITMLISPMTVMATDEGGLLHLGNTFLGGLVTSSGDTNSDGEVNSDGNTNSDGEVNSDGRKIKVLSKWTSDDGYVYQHINSDGEEMARVARYIGTATALDIPQKVKSPEGKELDVKAFKVDFSDGANVKTVNFPAGMKYIAWRRLDDFFNLENITVDSGNTSYKAVDGVLYKYVEGGSKVIVYPKAKKDTEWVMENDVVKPFWLPKKSPLISITLSPNITEEDIWMVAKARLLESVHVPAGSSIFSSKDGVLFNADGTKLMYYPRGRNAAEYTVPDGTRSLAYESFYFAEDLSTVKLPGSIEEIERDVFDDENKFEKLIFTGKSAPSDPYRFNGIRGMYRNEEIDIEYPENSTGYDKFLYWLKSYAFAIIPNNTATISAGQNKLVNIQSEGQVVTFRFTPSEDGTYYFESLGSFDTEGCLMTSDEFIEYDDDNGTGNNFSIESACKAGTAYYIQTRLLDQSKIASYNIKVRSESSSDGGSGGGVSGGGGGGSAYDDPDKTAADSASSLINRIPFAEKVTIADKDAITEARAAYDALTPAQKALVSKETLAKLEAAEAALKSAEKVKDVEDSVDSLPAVSEVSTADKAAIESAEAAYDALTEAEKASFSSEKKAKLDEAVAALAKAELKEASNISKTTVTKGDIQKASALGATSVTLGAKVKKISKNAFKGTKIKTITVKSKKLKAKKVKGSLKGSKVKTIKVKVSGSKKTNRKYIKKYKKIFTKKNVGRKVTVK